MKYSSFSRFLVNEYGSKDITQKISFTCPLDYKLMMEYFVDRIENSEMEIVEAIISNTLEDTGEKVEIIRFNVN